ncbi:sugar kinase [Oscillatoriales cyanobacterium LEGE 11467]|uniref:Sugar kinase n=1 Tax=Zarconia navalis LEGE 11467 TaxID=1828826 RepID=A0A928VZY6_9CYAN|nr:PfkB family carbohydrate kinase [Zarconia navalis]MBE9040755.1 sugar kinase [Zarconia navalis LEGE 11467]
MKTGLFVGAITLDLVYLVERFPRANQKVVASDRTIAAGGPATNAAVAFAAHRNRATVMGVLGCHPIAELIRSDLEGCGVEIIDLQPDRADPPTVSSIVVTQSTGERSVISTNATKAQFSDDLCLQNIQNDALQNIDIVLMDGHQMELSEAIARQAKVREIPVVIDGGSWKPGFDRVLNFADYAICSANFFPPTDLIYSDANKNLKGDDVFTYLQNLDIPNIAITYGEKPIEVFSQDKRFQVDVSPIQAVDTLGAGDIFHGAFCSYILQQKFAEALKNAARVAARSCESFGTRNWRSSIDR